MRPSQMQRILGLPNDPTYTPYFVSCLELLTAFLAGFALTESLSRYATATSTLIKFMDNVENLRIQLLSGTNDPKFRYAVQVFITWFVVMVRKKITFYTEDFTKSVGVYISTEMEDCILFQPEVLWLCEEGHCEYLFLRFLREAKMDRFSTFAGTYDAAIGSLKNLQELLMSQPPKTKAVMTRIVCDAYIISIPLLNRDNLTRCLLPFVGGFFILINNMAEELSNPWGTGGEEDPHDLPLQEVLAAVSAPTWPVHESESYESSMKWLNRGLTESVWIHDGHVNEKGKRVNEIPRKKNRGEGRGEEIDFDDFRSIPDLMGKDSWNDFILHGKSDMDAAISRGRRMPYYLRWKDWMGLSWDDYMARVDPDLKIENRQFSKIFSSRDAGSP
jgi:hypothetical protein